MMPLIEVQYRLFSFMIMEKRQGFFSALKEDIVRGLSPSRSRSVSPARSVSPFSPFLRRKHSNSEQFVPKSGALAPLMEGPDPNGRVVIGDSKRFGGTLTHWMKGPVSRASSASSNGYDYSGNKRCDPRLLLGVMGASLVPVHVCSMETLPHLSIKDTPIMHKNAREQNLAQTPKMMLA